mgnify:CR=1 FL=1
MVAIGFAGPKGLAGQVECIAVEWSSRPWRPVSSPAGGSPLGLQLRLQLVQPKQRPYLCATSLEHSWSERTSQRLCSRCHSRAHKLGQRDATTMRNLPEPASRIGANNEAKITRVETNPKSNNDQTRIEPTRNSGIGSALWAADEITCHI